MPKPKAHPPAKAFLIWISLLVLAGAAFYAVSKVSRPQGAPQAKAETEKAAESAPATPKTPPEPST